MKSNVIKVNSQGEGITEALTMTEGIAQACGLDKKQSLQLRLLSEELFGMLKGIAGEVEAAYWLIEDKKSFELHMKSDISMTDDMKKQLIAASTSGKNDAARGFMGKIRVMIASYLSTTKEALPYAMMNAAIAYPMTGMAASDTSMMWSMEGYRDIVTEQMKSNDDAKEAWDELEKSIIANIADDIKVKVVGSTVEIIVNKSF